MLEPSDDLPDGDRCVFSVKARMHACMHACACVSGEDEHDTSVVSVAVCMTAR